MMGLPFLSMPLVMGKVIDGPDGAGFGGMGSGGADDKLVKAEGPVWACCGLAWAGTEHEEAGWEGAPHREQVRAARVAKMRQ